MLTLMSVIALVLSVATPQAGTKAEQPDPRENLNTAIEEGIRLLEKKEHAKFLQMFIEPKMLASRRDKFEDFAAAFGQKNADRLLAALKQISKAKPTMSADGTMATYQIEPPSEQGPRTLRWEKTGKFWYIAN